jgi:glycosyltransferase involved in cell wall biosynthesis
MYRGASTAVVIPAFNEELAIARAIATVPDLVDHVIVVDDASHDATFAEAARATGRSVEIVRHPRNRGVGAAIVSGYRRVLALGLDVAVVMAGDGQMDPADLPALLDPICDGQADYAKGNRFQTREVWRAMPRARLVGNVALSLCTKLTSGYWHVFDSQCGYTAATRAALSAIDLDQLFPRYGYPNDLLARLHAAGMRVTDVPVRPIYGPAWKSGIRAANVLYPISYVLVKSWLDRLEAEGRAAGSRTLST